MSDLDKMDWPEIFERLTEVGERFFYKGTKSLLSDEPQVRVNGQAQSVVHHKELQTWIIHAALRKAIHEEGWHILEELDNWRIYPQGPKNGPEANKLAQHPTPEQSRTIDLARAYLKAKENQEPSLKPCPFCGGEATIDKVRYNNKWSKIRRYEVHCLWCGIHTLHKADEQEAIQAWNQLEPS